REFWVTRPYSWRSLLGAKALFIAAFILTPLLIADIATLAADRFPVPLLGLARFEFARLVILVPFVLLASVTNGTRQFLLALFLLFGVIYATAEFHMYRGLEDRPPLGIPFITIAFPLALVLWQYAVRRAWLVRGIAAAACIYMLVPTASSVSEIGVAHP